MQAIDLSALTNSGRISARPFMVSEQGRIDPESCQQLGTAENMHLRYRYPGGCQDDFYLKCEDGAYLCKRYFKNAGGELDLQELGLELFGINFAGNAADDYFYHNENPRIYERMTFPLDYDRTGSGSARDSGFDSQAGNRWADPGVVCERIGRSPYQPFPAILLSNYASESGLVHGTLSQKVFYHNYLAEHQDGKIRFQVFSGFKGIRSLRCPAGKILLDEWYLGGTDEAADLEKIFAGYTEQLRRHLPPLYGATAINRTSMVWGSWNDGIMRKISDEMILQEASYLKENFPMVEWIQVDDGYAVHVPPAHGLGMPYEGEAGVDAKKFPDGLRAYSDKLRAIGLRPAVWIGGFCPKHTPIYQDHPEWFVDYDYRVEASAPLDVSLPEVRQYLEKALDVFFREYAFEGMKHDFWSYVFEDSHDLMKNRDASGYEWRSWWLKEVRKRLPDDAYLQTGCDIVMGNPFLGEFFTNYRYGIDIGSGNWDYVKINFLWGIACFATHTSDLFVPNSDSVGLFPGLNDTEAMFCLNYCLVTHTMVEIAGKLSQAAPNNPRLKALKKATCNPNNGQEIFLARYHYRDDQQAVPRILYFKTPHFSTTEEAPGLPLRTVGLFNVEDEEISIEFTAADLNLPEQQYLITDVWSGETLRCSGSHKLSVEAHGSRLLSISPVDGPQILDGNLKVEPTEGCAFKVPWGGEAEFFLNFTPGKMLCNGENLPFIAEPGKGNTKVTFKAPAKSIVEWQAE